MELGFKTLGKSDMDRQGEVPTDRKDTKNEVRSIPLITAKRVSVQIEPVGARSSRIPAGESTILVALSPQLPSRRMTKDEFCGVAEWVEPSDEGE
jgi:hypothetical protein